MAGKIATRNAYGETLVELAEKYPELVVLDADLSGSTMSKFFATAYPHRFFNCGIAECNMAGIAAGMAADGLKPFINSFAMFSTGRIYEQIRNSIAYPQLNVKVVGSHGGVSVGEDGATHQCIEDFALMRAIPGMMVCCPCDANEMRFAVRALMEYNGPAYLRLQRLATDVFTDELENYSFQLGKGCVLKDGSDMSILATGLMVSKALQAAELLEADGIHARIINIHTLKPLDDELVIKAARETGCILTTEEHSILGGLGSAVCELLSEKFPVPVVRHGVNDEFGRSGSAADVLEFFGLTAQGIAEKAKYALSLKK